MVLELHSINIINESYKLIRKREIKNFHVLLFIYYNMRLEIEVYKKFRKISVKLIKYLDK